MRWVGSFANCSLTSKEFIVAHESYRDQLIATRPKAMEYAESLRKLPAYLTSLKDISIERLTLYPIKSLGGINVTKVMVSSSGLQTVSGSYTDRSAMLVQRQEGTINGHDFDCVRFSQREESALVLAQARSTIEGLQYSALDMEDFLVSPALLKPVEGQAVQVRMFPKGDGGLCSGVYEKGPVTAWVRKFLKQHKRGKYDVSSIEVLLPRTGDRRLVEEQHRRGLNAATRFTDGGQILVASASTAHWMNMGIRKCPRRNDNPIDIQAFRPNIVLEGLPANVEDVIDEMWIRTTAGYVPMLFGQLSVRCSVTTLDVISGEKIDNQPLTWLLENRPKRPESKENSATFGVNTVIPEQFQGQVISVGDSVSIVKEK